MMKQRVLKAVGLGLGLGMLAAAVVAAQDGQPAQAEVMEASVDEASRQMHPPHYPAAAREAGRQGSTVLIVGVDVDGTVFSITVERSSRHRDLDRAAMDSARHWRYHPRRIDGQPTVGNVRVTVDFNP
jgi:protein TonB